MGNLTARDFMSIQNEMLSMEHGVGSGAGDGGKTGPKDQGSGPAVARDECRVARSTVREEGWQSGKV